jgi:hypothetical protein
MAPYLERMMLEGMSDQETGGGSVWLARFGRRVLTIDGFGFREYTRHTTEASAIRELNLVDSWANDAFGD